MGNRYYTPEISPGAIAAHSLAMDFSPMPKQSGDVVPPLGIEPRPTRLRDGRSALS